MLKLNECVNYYKKFVLVVRPLCFFVLSLGYAHVLIGLLVHVRRCAQRLYILTTSEDSGGHESLAPLFWGLWAEKFGNPCTKAH